MGRYLSLKTRRNKARIALELKEAYPELTWSTIAIRLSAYDSTHLRNMIKEYEEFKNGCNKK